MSEWPRAEEIVLCKFKPMAPPFHQHIARAKLKGNVWQTGDRVVVYEIAETVPEGRVLAAEDTIIRFR